MDRRFRGVETHQQAQFFVGRYRVARALGWPHCS